MVYMLIVLLLLLVFVIYLLWAPIVLFIDTASNQYFVRYGALAKAMIEGDSKEVIRLRLRVLFMTFKFYPLQWRRSKKSDTKKQKKDKKRRTWKLSTITRLIRSFRINRFLLDIDTGDYVLNAKLYPVMTLAQFSGAQVTVNFQDRNRLVLEVENRAIDILKCFINLK